MPTKSKNKPKPQPAKLYTIIVRDRNNAVVAQFNSLSGFAFKRRLPLIEDQYQGKNGNTVHWSFEQ